MAHIGAYEKLGLFALGMVIFVVVAPKAMAFFMGSVASIATLSRPTIGGAAPRQPERCAAERSAATELGFGRAAVESVGGDWQAASEINAELVRLQQRRMPSIIRAGDTPHARLAWKIAVASQAALYRLVALADAATTLWNFRNPLGAIVTATSLLENTAAFAAYEQHLTKLVASSDLPALDAYVMQSAFANALDGTAAAQDTKAGTAIDFLPDAAQATYARLASMASTATLTNYRMFGTLDKTDTSVAFSDAESFDKAVLEQLMAAIGVIETLTDRFAAIDAVLISLESK